MPKGNLVWVWKLKVLFFKELARPKRLFLAYFGRQWINLLNFNYSNEAQRI